MYAIRSYYALHSLVASKLGMEGVKIVIPNVKKAESEIAAFLWEQRSNLYLTCSFVVGRKTWKSKNLYSYRMQGRIVEVCSGRKGQPVVMNGQASAYPFSFICCVVPPRPTLVITSYSIHYTKLYDHAFSGGFHVRVGSTSTWLCICGC